MENKKLKHVSNVSFEIDEIISLYSSYVDISIELGDYFNNIMRELGLIAEFDVACLVVLEGEIAKVFKYESGEVEDKTYMLSEISETIYAKMFEDMSVHTMNMNVLDSINGIEMFTDTYESKDSFIALPVVYNNNVVAVLALSSKNSNISDSQESIEVYIDLLKIRIVNQLSHQSTRFNEEIVYALDYITDGYFVIRDDLVTLSKKAQEISNIQDNVVKIEVLLGILTDESREEARAVLSSGLEVTSQILHTKDCRALKLDSFLVELRNNNTMTITVVHDITNEKQKLEQFESLAFIDSLTKLKNYNSLMDCLSKISEYEETTVINFDINKFKLINDTYGHDVGDIALIFFGRVLKKVYKNLTKNIFRKSGDEFIVILGDDIDHSQKIDAFEKLTAYFEDRENYPERLPINLEYSAGVASSNKIRHKKEDLFRFADVAMYQAKKDAGGLPYVFFDEEHFELYSIEQENLRRIKSAIEHSEIDIWYRPIDNRGESKKIYKVSKKIKNVGLSGREITQLAEKNDLLYDFEKKIIELVFIEKRKLLDSGKKPAEIHIPIGVENMVVDSFFDYVVELTNKYNLKTELIVFVVSGLDNTSKIETVSLKLGKYVYKGYKLSFDFKFLEFPNPYYTRLVDFTYCNIPGRLLKVISDGNSCKDAIYIRTTFDSMRELSVEPIFEDVYVEDDMDIIVDKNIDYYIKVGNKSVKNIEDLISSEE